MGNCFAAARIYQVFLIHGAIEAADVTRANETGGIYTDWIVLTKRSRHYYGGNAATPRRQHSVNSFASRHPARLLYYRHNASLVRFARLSDQCVLTGPRCIGSPSTAS
jgi:hypothetical protein